MLVNHDAPPLPWPLSPDMSPPTSLVYVPHFPPQCPPPPLLHATNWPCLVASISCYHSGCITNTVSAFWVLSCCTLPSFPIHPFFLCPPPPPPPQNALAATALNSTGYQPLLCQPCEPLVTLDLEHRPDELPATLELECYPRNLLQPVAFLQPPICVATELGPRPM